MLSSSFTECSKPSYTAAKYTPDQPKYYVGDTVTFGCTDLHTMVSTTASTPSKCTDTGFLPAVAVACKKSESCEPLVDLLNVFIVNIDELLTFFLNNMFDH